MIISVEEAKTLVDINDWSDVKIERKLKSIEQTIRAYTNNNFQARGFRSYADIVSGGFVFESPILFKVGDTVQVSFSRFNDGLFEVMEKADETTLTVNGNTYDETGVMVTKVKYPHDVIDCCVNLLEWEIKNRDKVGIQSETLSKHSVTYFNQDADNQVMGYPVSLLGCLKAYRKARC